METKIKERPILFSAPMVRAILAGQKTQTRRIVNPRYSWEVEDSDGVNKVYYPCYVTGEPDPMEVPCPYGDVGERLWVRENWRWTVDKKAKVAIEYQADGEIRRALCENGGEGELVATEKYENQLLRLPSTLNWKPSIHMPRAASRIILEIVRVCVEPLQDLSCKDAIAEGIEQTSHPSLSLRDQTWRDYSGLGVSSTCCPQASYATLWDSINGPGAWDLNPWVWVVEFKKVNP